MRGSRDPILEFWETSNISLTVEAKNFKFGKQTEGADLQRKKIQNWVEKGHVGVTWPNIGILGPP